MSCLVESRADSKGVMQRPLPRKEGAFPLVAGEDLNLRPLGYEQRDARLCRLGRSLLAALTSGNSRREVASGFPRLPYPGPSRRISCRNPCIKRLRELGFPLFERVRVAHTPACRFIPVTVGPPSRSGPGPTGQGGAPCWTNDLDAWGLVCAALPGPMVTGEPDTRLSHTRTLPLLPGPSWSPRSRRRHKNFTAALQVQMAVYLAAMADSSNGDYPGLIVHDVDDAVITHPHSQPG
jgi:hypothetical protein